MARGRFMFWLDFNKDEELLLAEQIDNLKQKRRFTSTVRDGIRLVCDLQQGRIETLFELFPDLRRKLKPVTGNFDGGVGGNDRITKLEGQIEQLERLLISGNNELGVALPSPQKSISEPDFVIQKDTSQDAAKNLLGAMSGLM